MLSIQNTAWHKVEAQLMITVTFVKLDLWKNGKKAPRAKAQRQDGVGCVMGIVYKLHQGSCVDLGKKQRSDWGRFCRTGQMVWIFFPMREGND